MACAYVHCLQEYSMSAINCYTWCPLWNERAHQERRATRQHCKCCYTGKCGLTICSKTDPRRVDTLQRSSTSATLHLRCLPTEIGILPSVGFVATSWKWWWKCKKLYSTFWTNGNNKLLLNRANLNILWHKLYGGQMRKNCTPFLRRWMLRAGGVIWSRRSWDSIQGHRTGESEGN